MYSSIESIRLNVYWLEEPVIADERSGLMATFTRLNVERLVWSFVVRLYDAFSNIP